jgi:hypothetical protein
MSQLGYEIGETIWNIVKKKIAASPTIMSGVFVSGSVTEDNTCSCLLSIDDEATPTAGIVVNTVAGGVDGLQLVPAEGAHVVVAVVDGDKYKLLWASAYALARIKVGEMQLELTSAGCAINGGGLGGLVKVNDLVTKLNNLESLVNDLIEKYNAHTHTSACTAGGATTAPVALGDRETGTISATVVSDLENLNVTHG